MRDFGTIRGMNEVNQRLRSAVELAGIRRPELASLLGVSVTTVNGWFSSGRTIPKLKQNAIEAIVKQARRPELKFDDIVSFSVRLTPLEWKRLCDIAGAESLSPHEAEAKVRELLHKTWNHLRARS